MRIALASILLGALAVAMVPASAPAQNREIRERLQHAARVDCRFTRVATGDWNGGETQVSSEPADLTMAFFDIDVESGTAEAEGRIGTSYIIVRYADGYLHFMQSLSSGPLYLTTILPDPSSDGRLKAVHTRHEFTQVRLPGFTSRPEMYLGDCAVE
jgi:hypothetical protein